MTQNANSLASMQQVHPQNHSEFAKSIHGKFNPEQFHAITLENISSLVLAGAGSGKTTVIVNRIAYIVNNGIMPKCIMAVTFTNKASEEMKIRLKTMLHREQVAEIWTGTFHSLMLRMLRENYEIAGLPKNFAVLDVDSQQALIKTITKDKNLTIDTDADESSNEKISSKDVVQFINSKKEQGIRPNELMMQASNNNYEFIQLFYEYELACKEQGLLDFSDLLYKTVDMLERHPSVREKYNSKFSAILVDEFQDTNDIQYRWLKAIKGKNSFVMAVGDDDQSIYAFRGANPSNMERFVREMTESSEYPKGKIIRLEQNYRSLPYILESANAVIDKNSGRLGKKLWTNSKDNNERIEIVTYENGSFEAKGIAEEINRLVKSKNVQPSEIACLYRTNLQSRLIEQEIVKYGIPVTVYGGFRFYERLEIKHVLAYLDLTSSIDRDIAFSRVVNFPPRGIGDRTVEDLRQEAKSQNVSMIEMIARRMQRGYENMTAGEIKKQKALEEFVYLIIDLAEESASCNLSEIVEKIISKSGILAHYKNIGDEESLERIENIGELVSAAKQFEVDHPELNNALLQLPEYLSSIQLLTSTSDSDMDKKNTVSLMTVHSAKGLEFDNVFVAGMEDGVFPHFRSIENEESIDAEAILAMQGKVLEYKENGELSDETEALLQSIHNDPSNAIDSDELQEERRLLYVAITRAKINLKISLAKNRMMMGKETSQTPSRFIKEIPSHRVFFTESVKKGLQKDKFFSRKKTF